VLVLIRDLEDRILNFSEEVRQDRKAVTLLLPSLSAVAGFVGASSLSDALVLN